MNLDNEFLWVEKYRPQTIEKTILPSELKTTFEQIIKTGELPNMLFTGSAGLGKTTVAKALCNSLGLDYILVNGSEEGNIDTLRGKIKQFASSIYLNAQSTQPALRAFIEEFSNNCRFILTCNFKNRIIEPLHSRCGVYEFNTSKKDLTVLATSFYKRARNILEQENVTYEHQDLVDIIMKHAPDWRRVLNELQRRSVDGVLSSSGSSSSTGTEIDILMKYIKEKDFKKMRSWVVNNIDTDASSIFRGIYDRMYNHMKPASVPQVVLILADYQYKQAFVADHELNVVACMTELMANVEFQ